ncbi:coniferyl aldehyde dehydrogenase [Luteimonas mephitis]|uniref:coniferyl aldehyde dehydrogenase n=1 Tax=Luteimonas mephitis TaxID=83615 RepID=UPI00042341C1|nr:coniferyl aldehyde dehydrogenase [Luteimonas mephitis]
MDTLDSPASELRPTLDRLRDAWRNNRPDARQRLDDLARLRDAFKAGRGAMLDAVGADFGHRSAHETLLGESMPVTAELDHLRGKLRSWMKPRRVGSGWRLWPARAQLRPEPLGVVGVMSPWNYPINLALIPLATAIAAGNHVYLKPSEHTPRTSAWLRDLLAQVFPADRVAVALGDATLGAQFSALPFDHLVFTGSTAVGRKVMAAAAPNLTPLTLELGGKSPAIVAADFPPAQAAARLATGKWLNAGQTCIAPDYVLVDHASRDALVAALREQARSRYGDLKQADDLTRIINEGQYRRLRGYLDDARARGLEVIELIALDPVRAEAERMIAPTLVLEPGDDASVMREEIFGPILPIRSYRNLDEALDWVEAGDRPLALYPFSRDRATVERILGRLLAGGVTVNDTLLHFAAGNLPFGGVGASGMGQYHGRAGFDAMTHAMPVLWQPRKAASDLLKPPYRGFVERMVQFLAG